MQIYFGAVNKFEAHDPSFMYASDTNQDHLFYYGLEYGSNPGGLEEATIYDGVGRSIPVDVASIPSLIDALKSVLIFSQVADEAKGALDKILSANGNISFT